MNLALNLKRLRLERGLTQAALAERCGIAQPNLAAMEQGRRQPTLATLQRLAQAFECDLAELVSDRVPELNHLLMHRVCKRLVESSPPPKGIDAALWRDLNVTFRPKLRALRPSIPRPRLRISARAAQSRVKARLGRKGFDEMTRRLEMFQDQ